MSYRLQVRLAAEADVAEAAQWYDQRQPGLGEKFVREVDQAIARVVENPLALPVILRRHEVRRALTKRFPYRIFLTSRRTRRSSGSCRRRPKARHPKQK
jgi:toxin ParE1/3/4